MLKHRGCALPKKDVGISVASCCVGKKARAVGSDFRQHSISVNCAECVPHVHLQHDLVRLGVLSPKVHFACCCLGCVGNLNANLLGSQMSGDLRSNGVHKQFASQAPKCVTTAFFMPRPPEDLPIGTRRAAVTTDIRLRKSRLRFVCKMLQVKQGICVCIWLSEAPSGSSCATPKVQRWNLGQTLSPWLQQRKEKIPIVLECIRRVDKHLQGATSSSPLGHRP